MIDKIKKTLQDVTEAVKEQASTIGEGAKEKTYQVIEDWLKIFPKLEIYGLEMTSMALSVAISPALEAELMGEHKNFPIERLDQILEKEGKNPAMFSVFNTIKSTYNLHRKTYASLKDPLIVKIKIRISPEIKVFLGKPVIE